MTPPADCALGLQTVSVSVLNRKCQLKERRPRLESEWSESDWLHRSGRSCLSLVESGCGCRCGRGLLAFECLSCSMSGRSCLRCRWLIFCIAGVLHSQFRLFLPFNLDWDLECRLSASDRWPSSTRWLFLALIHLAPWHRSWAPQLEPWLDLWTCRCRRVESRRSCILKDSPGWVGSSPVD